MTAPQESFYETLLELGESVTKWQILGRVQSLTQIEAPVPDVSEQIDVMLITRARRTHVKVWATITLFATDFDITEFDYNTTF